MNIYPAIDLLSGKCVRLYQGCYNQVSIYDNDPVNVAQTFVTQGASSLHIVDLDGAKEGNQVNLDTIIKIQHATGLNIQVGGGIRSKKQVSDMFELGIHRVILGSIAIAQPYDVMEWMQEFGADRFVLALDIRINKTNDPIVALHGWEKESDTTLWKVLDEYQQSSLRHVLCTDISRDGTLNGPNIDLYTECVKRYPNIAFQASGGVSTLKDLTMLSSISVAGVIVGKALYENKFSLTDALKMGCLC